MNTSKTITSQPDARKNIGLGDPPHIGREWAVTNITSQAR